MCSVIQMFMSAAVVAELPSQTWSCSMAATHQGTPGGGVDLDLEEHQQWPTNSISHSSHLDLFPVILH